MNSSASVWQRAIAIAPFVLWGSGMVVMKGPLAEASPLFIAIMRLVPAGAIVLAAVWMAGKWNPQWQLELVPRSWQAWLWIAVFALLDGTLFEGFLIEGLQDTDAGLGSVLIDTQPLAVAVMAAAFYRERINRLGWLSLLCGAFGIGAIGLSSQLHGGAFHWANLSLSGGTVLMLLSALSMAAATVMMPQISKHANPIVATGWHLFLGGLPLVALSALTETHQWDRLGMSGWLGIGYIAFFTSALAYALFFYSASRENLTQFSSLTFLTPVFALGFGSIFLHETLNPLQWCGVGLTLVSVYVMHHRDRLLASLRAFFDGMWTPADEEASRLEPEPVEVSR
ncbi:MAG: DMT family transporter [Cyanobacteria bacterium P01_D01_bin.123]